MTSEIMHAQTRKCLANNVKLFSLILEMIPLNEDFDAAVRMGRELNQNILKNWMLFDATQTEDQQVAD